MPGKTNKIHVAFCVAFPSRSSVNSNAELLLFCQLLIGQLAILDFLQMASSLTCALCSLPMTSPFIPIPLEERGLCELSWVSKPCCSYCVPESYQSLRLPTAGMNKAIESCKYNAGQRLLSTSSFPAPHSGPIEPLE